MKRAPAWAVKGEVPVLIEARGVQLEGRLSIPEGARGLVVFAQPSGCGRKSLRYPFVARRFFEGGLATLLLDLLTDGERAVDRLTGKFRFNLDLLAGRLIGVTDWARNQPDLAPLRLGYFASSTGAAAAFVAAGSAGCKVGAVVSRGGRPDLAGGAISRVEVPALFIVGGEDRKLLALNRESMEKLSAEKRLEVIAGAGRHFREPGALEDLAWLAREWFLEYLDGGIDCEVF